MKKHHQCIPGKSPELVFQTRQKYSLWNNKFPVKPSEPVQQKLSFECQCVRVNETLWLRWPRPAGICYCRLKSCTENIEIYISNIWTWCYLWIKLTKLWLDLDPPSFRYKAHKLSYDSSWPRAQLSVKVKLIKWNLWWMD